MKKIAPIVFLFYLLCPAFVNAESRRLTIVYPQEKNSLHDAAAEIIRQAYAELGIEVVYKTFPAERALHLSNNGAADGELVRIKGINKKYQNLLWIPVSHVTANQMAFTRKPGLAISGWTNLRAYKIVFHRGYKVAENNTKGMKPYLAKSDKAGFKMVENGRMDVVIANQFTGLKLLKEMALKKVIMIEPPLQSDPLFHYLHNKHRALAPKVIAVLKKMRETGRMTAIKKSFGFQD